MLHFFIERTGLIVLMILHQPSDEILEAMHSITVMMKGQIAFHQEDMMHFNPEVGQAQFVHQMLRDGSSNLTDIAGITEVGGENVGSKSRDIPPRGIPKGLSIVQPSAFQSRRFLDANIDIEQQEGHERSKKISEYIDRAHYDALSRLQPSVESSPRATRFTITSRLEDLVSNAISFIKQLPSAIVKEFTSLWQVQPLLQRMQLHVGTPWLDFGVVLVVLVVAGWSRYSPSVFGINGKLSGIMLGLSLGFTSNHVSHSYILPTLSLSQILLSYRFSLLPVLYPLGI